MGRSAGAGHPLHFRCTALARLWPRTNRDYDAHNHRLTGRTRATPANGHHHPRKSWVTFEWACSCGKTGWSSHKDLERLAIYTGAISANDTRLAGPTRKRQTP